MSEKELNKIIADNITRQMELNNRTQLELAEYMNVSQATVSNWCKGVKMPRMDKVDKICSIFNIKRSDLIEDHADKPINNTFIYTAEETNLINKYRTLNEAGQDKVNDYIDDLASSEKYRKSGASSLNTTAHDPSDRNASKVLKNINDSKIKSAL